MLIFSRHQRESPATSANKQALWSHPLPHQTESCLSAQDLIRQLSVYV